MTTFGNSVRQIAAATAFRSGACEQKEIPKLMALSDFG